MIAMRNIIIVIADSLRYDTFHDIFRDLRDDALEFTFAWSAGAATYPGFFSLWTGLLPHEHGAYKPYLIPAADGLDTKMKRAGYNTIVISENPFTYPLAEVRLHYHGCGFEVMEPPPEPYCIIYHNMTCHHPYVGHPDGYDVKELNKRARKDVSKHDIELMNDAYNFSTYILASNIRRLITRGDMVVLTSDHGEGFYEHGFFGHPNWRMYSELLRVPLAIWNGDNVGTIDKLTSTMDLFDILMSPKDYCGRPYVAAQSYEREDHQASFVLIGHIAASMIAGEKTYYDIFRDEMMIQPLADEVPMAIAMANAHLVLPKIIGHAIEHNQDDIEYRLKELGYIE